MHFLVCIYFFCNTPKRKPTRTFLLYVQARKRDENTMFCFVFCVFWQQKKRGRKYSKKVKAAHSTTLLQWRDLREALFFCKQITFWAPTPERYSLCRWIRLVGEGSLVWRMFTVCTIHLCHTVESLRGHVWAAQADILITHTTLYVLFFPTLSHPILPLSLSRI